MKHLLLALALLTATAAHAGPTTLVGDQIDAAMIRTIDTGYGLGRIFGYGLDAPFVVQDGNADQHQYSSAFKLDVDGNKFSIRFLQLAGWQDGIVLRLSDLDFSPIGSVLSSVSVNTNLAGYTLTTGADWIDLGLEGRISRQTPTSSEHSMFLLCQSPRHWLSFLSAFSTSPHCGSEREILIRGEF